MHYLFLFAVTLLILILGDNLFLRSLAWFSLVVLFTIAVILKVCQNFSHFLKSCNSAVKFACG